MSNNTVVVETGTLLEINLSIGRHRHAIRALADMLQDRVEADGLSFSGDSALGSAYILRSLSRDLEQTEDAIEALSRK